MALVPTVPGLSIRSVENPAELLAARRLHSQCFVEEGFIQESELGSDGLIHDDWVPFSDYFIATDEEAHEIVGTCRLIRPSVRGFPALQHFDPRPEAMEIFRSLDPNHCAEISALATLRNGMQHMAISGALYGAVWRRAIETRRAYLLAIVDDRMLMFTRRFLEIPIIEIGEPREFMGAKTTPTAIYVPRAAESMAPDNLRFFSGEIPFSELEQVVVDLRNEVPEIQPPIRRVPALEA